MNGKRVPSSRVFSFGSIFVLLLVVLLTSYYFYVEKQQEQFSQYLLRQLAVSSINISDVLNRLNDNVGTAAINKTNEPPKETIGKKLRLIPFLDMDSFDWNKNGPRDLTEKADIESEVLFKKSYGERFLKITASHGKNDEIFSINAKLNDLLIPSFPDDIFDNFDGGVFIAKKETGEVITAAGSLRQLTTLPINKSGTDAKRNGGKTSEEPEEGTEEEIAEADAEEESQIKDVEIALEKYKMFLQPVYFPSGSLFDAGPEQEDYAAVQGNTSSGPGGDGAEQGGASREPNSGEDEYLLVGLVPKSTFLAKTMEIAPTPALIILCSFFVGLLALPFLRIRFIGPREGLKAHDVPVLVVALAVGCSLATLALVHCLTHSSEKAVQGKILETTAGDIERNFKKEFGLLEEELIKQTQKAKKMQSGQADDGDGRLRSSILSSSEEEGGEEDKITHPLFEMVFGMDEEGTQKWKWSVKNTPTSMLAIKDREYFYQPKNDNFNYFPESPDSDHLSEEDFVRGWYIQSIRSKTTGEAYAILSLRHKGYDMRMEKDADNTNRVTVSAIEAKPLCLINPIMPHGYGFALIDQSGAVQFHSHASRNLHENFFEETKPQLHLRSIVSSGAQRHITIEYRANPCRAFIKPFPGTPWTLIVFAEKRTLDRMNLETLTFSLTLYGLYLVVFLAACISAHYLLRSETAPGEARRILFWPDKSRLPDYRYLFGWMILFTGIWFAGNFLNQILQIVWCAVYPIILLWIVCRVLKYGPAERTGRMRALVEGMYPTIKRLLRKSGRIRNRIEQNELKWTYMLLTAAFYLNVAVLPIFSFYNAVHKEEAEVFVKYHQMKLAQALGLRAERYEKFFKETTPSEPNRKKMRDLLHFSTESTTKQSDDAPNDFMDVYTLESPTSRVHGGESIKELNPGHDTDPVPQIGQELIAWLSEWTPVPAYDEISSVTRQLADPGTFKAYNFPWTRAENPGYIRFHKKRYRTSGMIGSLSSGEDSDSIAAAQPVSLQIDTPIVYHPYGSLLQLFILYQHGFLSGLIIISFAGIALLLWMTRTIQSKIFLTGLRFPLSLNGQALAAPQKPGASDKSPDIDRQIRIRLPKETTNDSLSPLVIDIQHIRSGDPVAELVHRVKISPAPEVVLAQFDLGLDEPEIVEKKLQLLEELTAVKNKKIIIQTSIDPLFYLTSKAHDLWLKKDERQIPIARWATVLRGYAKLRDQAGEDEYYRLREEFQSELLKEACKTLPEAIQKSIRGKCEDLKEDPSKGNEAGQRALREKFEQELINNTFRKLPIRRLVDEGWPNSLLKAYARKIVLRPELSNFTPADIVDQIRDLADAHYRKIWLSCSTDEKILIYRLAQEGFINWRMEHSLRSLIRRRIIIAAPNFRLMNESFRQFVLQAENPGVFEEWEKAAGTSLWSRIRTPIFISGAVLAVFFFATQRELFSQSLKVLAALTAGVPLLIKLITLLLPSQNSSSPQA